MHAPQSRLHTQHKQQPLPCHTPTNKHLKLATFNRSSPHTLSSQTIQLSKFRVSKCLTRKKLKLSSQKSSMRDFLTRIFFTVFLQFKLSGILLLRQVCLHLSRRQSRRSPPTFRKRLRHKKFGKNKKKTKNLKPKQITGEAYSQDLALWWVLESLREALQ